MRRNRHASALLAVLLLAACAGDVGPTGPTGPAGPAGPQGPVGTANVITGTVSRTNADFISGGRYRYRTSATTETAYGTRTSLIPVPALTASVRATALVLVYMQVTPAEPFMQPLVYRFLASDRSFYYVHAFVAEDEGIRLHYFHDGLPGQPSINAEQVTLPTRNYQYFIIPASVASNLQADGVNLRDRPQLERWLAEHKVHVETQQVR